MSYIKRITPFAIVFTLLLGMCNLCSANSIKHEQKPLILTIDTTKPLTFSPPETKKHTFKKTTPVQHDSVISKKLKRAKQVLNKMTSLKYGKNQKIKAYLGKSSYRLQYTHTL